MPRDGSSRLIDLVERMRNAFPPEVAISKAEWLEARSQQATNGEEMLRQNLETENEALQAYRDALASVEGDEPIKFMIEEQIMTEQQDVWEIEKLLSMLDLKVEKKIELEA